MRCTECREVIVTRYRSAVGTCITCEVMKRGRAGGKDLDKYARELLETQEAIDAGLVSERAEWAFWDRHREADALTPDECAAILSVAAGAARCAHCGAMNIDSDRIVEHGEFFCDNEDEFEPCRVKWEREREEAFAHQEADPS